MKRQTVLTTLGLATALLVMKPHAIYTSTGYSGGTGIESDPYLISTPERLNQLRIEVNGGDAYENTYFKLSQDIDLKDFDNDGTTSNGNFIPIGASSTPFKGYFDGGNTRFPI